jgi:hypothetical protein
MDNSELLYNFLGKTAKKYFDGKRGTKKHIGLFHLKDYTSIINVAGPSLIKATCISAPN